MIDRYITKEGKKLRLGYTTGSCAAACSKACAMMLLSQSRVATVTLKTPAGMDLELVLEDIYFTENTARCAVRKDSGDDPDVTNGMLIYAQVTLQSNAEIAIDGGEGIGRVTKPGLDQPVGNAAINSVPRQMIVQELRSISQEFEYSGGFLVIISAPQGGELAKRTYNSRLGILGGISVLGTSGIVEPMSDSAIIDTIYTEIRQRLAEDKKYLLLTPGNYGEDFIKQNYHFPMELPIKCSNFMGDALDYAATSGCKGILVIGHGGKLIKLAGGLFNTHSRFGDCRAEIIAANAAACGLPAEAVEQIMQSVTVDEMLQIVQQYHLLDNVLSRILKCIEFNLNARVYGQIPVGALLFTLKMGFLGKTENAEMLLAKIKEEN